MYLLGMVRLKSLSTSMSSVRRDGGQIMTRHKKGAMFDDRGPAI